MYGGSKESGAIVGRVESSNAVALGLDEVGDNTGCEESLQCTDAEGNEITLSARLDSASGAIVWVKEISETEVEKRVLSTNQMTSMLHDKERNRVYEKAIEMNIANFMEQMENCPPTVLDVGAGTGLLGMMASRAGAGGVVGCEMYAPMAAVAEQVVRDNNMNEEVQIIPAKSTDIGGFKVDLLVSELLDSALLGESCIFSHADAINRLLTEEGEECKIPISERIIPHSATVYGKLVESSEIEKMVNIRDIFGSDQQGNKIGTPWRDETEAPKCKGGWPLIPMHWKTLKRRSAGIELSEESDLLRFDFTRTDASEDPQSFVSNLEVKLPSDHEEGRVSGLLVYWRLDLLSPTVDPKREIFYTTRPEDADEHWQDHWVQCIFPLPRPITGVKTGDKIQVVATHNNLNMWFDVQVDNETRDRPQPSKKPRRDLRCVEAVQTSVTQQSPCLCFCGWHMLLPTDRILMINDTRRQRWLMKGMEAALDTARGLATREGAGNVAEFVLDVGDSSVLALSAALHLQRSSVSDERVMTVVSREAKVVSHMLFSSLGVANHLDNFHCWDGQDLGEVVSYFDGGDEASNEWSIRILALISDLYQFQLSARPTWQALSFHYQRTAVGPFLPEGAPIFPGGARVMVACFELTDLHVSHGINGTVSGLDHSHLDRCQRGWQRNRLPYKLADYHKRLLCTPVALHTLNFAENAKNLPSHITRMPIVTEGRLDCLAVWVDYLSGTGGTDEAYLSYSSDNYPQAGIGADFPPHCKVNLLFAADHDRVQVTPSQHTVHVTSGFQLGESDIDIAFELRIDPS